MPAVIVLDRGRRLHRRTAEEAVDDRVVVHPGHGAQRRGEHDVAAEGTIPDRQHVERVDHLRVVVALLAGVLLLPGDLVLDARDLADDQLVGLGWIVLGAGMAALVLRKGVVGAGIALRERLVFRHAVLEPANAEVLLDRHRAARRTPARCPVADCRGRTTCRSRRGR